MPLPKTLGLPYSGPAPLWQWLELPIRTPYRSSLSWILANQTKQHLWHPSRGKKYLSCWLHFELRTSYQRRLDRRSWIPKRSCPETVATYPYRCPRWGWWDTLPTRRLSFVVVWDFQRVMGPWVYWFYLFVQHLAGSGSVCWREECVPISRGWHVLSGSM